jgi:DNA-binding transcriptional regulator LsrR (DeoR family)
MEVPVMFDSDENLVIRAAWLYYVGGLTQSAVARKLGIASAKAHRLIARAVAEGVVKVSIDGKVAECSAMEAQLSSLYGLSYCEVAPDSGEEGLPLNTLGHAGASFLQREIEAGTAGVIGIGHGRTLSSLVQTLPKISADDVRFVSLLGGLTRNYAANPFDVMHRLAERTGGQAYVMPVPYFANSAEDREVILAQRGVREVFDMASGAELKILGIGTVDPAAYLVKSGMLEKQEARDIADAGCVGEMLGQFFDRHGRVIETTLSRRALAASLSGASNERTVAIAGGTDKLEAIRAVLKSHLLTGLITDERTARALIAIEGSK